MYRMALKSDSEPVTHKFVDELEVEVRQSGDSGNTTLALSGVAGLSILLNC